MNLNYYEDEDDGRHKVFGTPLPALEKNENASKKPELDMTVRDQQGRRRFHGAFTGGFSAGHFNTVGSVEGWIPSQFKSSKAEKWSRDLVKHKPEDYMDDEDLDVFGIAHRTVKTTDKFTGDASTSFAGFRSDASKNIVDILSDMIKPAKQSVGVRILKLMKKDASDDMKHDEKESLVEEDVQTESESQAKVYGCQLPAHLMMSKEADDEQDDDDDDEALEGFVIPYKAKVDKHGLGYSGMNPETVKPKKTTSLELTASVGGKKLKIAGEAFGYGALSDEEDLDEDAEVYAKDNIDQYDFSTGGKSDKRRTWKGTSSVLNMDKLEGFVKESKSRSAFTDVSNKYRSPHIPRDWKPRPPWYVKRRREHRDGHRDSDGKRKSRWDITDDEVKRKREKEAKAGPDGNSARNKCDSKSESVRFNAHPLDANVRALLLGDKVARVSGAENSSSSLMSQVAAPPSLPTSSSNSEQFKHTDQRQDVTVNLKPLSGFFANKFTRSDKNALEQSSLMPGLIRMKEFAVAAPSSSNLEPSLPSKGQDERMQNEKSLIGSKRRCEFPWLPNRLLCKRFNVPQPGTGM
ncbi:G patch domain-containing protein 1 -like protein [Halotydeus destructor]|nr:G patch domain-containing protein 1 -like protein [Halotydeus destructor]